MKIRRHQDFFEPKTRGSDNRCYNFHFANTSLDDTLFWSAFLIRRRVRLPPFIFSYYHLLLHQKACSRWCALKIQEKALLFCHVYAIWNIKQILFARKLLRQSETYFIQLGLLNQSYMKMFGRSASLNKFLGCHV